MDELIDNFSKHINKLISNKLGSKIRNLARAKTSYRTEEDYSRLENNIQIVIESYLSNLKDNDYKEIANNIFNSFVEEDDKNLIKAVNFYKRTYEYYQEIKLRKKFFKWRKTALKLKMINNFLLEENQSKTKNFDKNNLIKKDINKIYKSKKEENKIKENYDLMNEQKNMENIDDNINEIKYENAQFYKKMNENVEDYIKKNNNNINKEIYKFNNELNDNDDDYKEEFSEELDYSITNL